MRVTNTVVTPRRARAPIAVTKDSDPLNDQAACRCHQFGPSTRTASCLGTIYTRRRNLVVTKQQVQDRQKHMRNKALANLFCVSPTPTHCLYHLRRTEGRKTRANGCGACTAPLPVDVFLLTYRIDTVCFEAGTPARLSGAHGGVFRHARRDLSGS